jgi:hypothetical protein
MFAEDIILYIEKPTYSIKKLLELISKFSKVVGYKDNIQKRVAFYTLSNLLRKNLRK